MSTESLAMPAGRAAWRVDCADNLPWLQELPDGCCSLTITSPPYESARTYGIGYKLTGQAWVDWMIPRVVEMCRVTNGLVCVNMAGQVRQHRYSPVVEWLVADLTRRHGLACGPAPYVYFRFGIPGSGGKRYHRRDHEPIYCFCRPEVLPLAWSDNVACGHPPKWAPSGEMSNRLAGGARVNQWGGRRASGRGTHASGNRQPPGRPSHDYAKPEGAPGLFGEVEEAPRLVSPRPREGQHSQESTLYEPPAIANPGNVVREKYDAEAVRQLLDDLISRRVEPGDVIRCLAGGGHMGDSRLAHESEAPFPETLVEFFARSYCPPGGAVLDPFCGSGASGAVAVRLGRRFLGCDIRLSQCAVARLRIARETPDLFAGKEAAE